MNNSRKSTKFVFAIALALLMLVLACDESLPPRNDPSILFKGYLSTKYSLLWNENVLRVVVSLVNIYDETVQAKASITGTVEVALIRNTAYRKTIHFNASHLITPKFYNSITQELTINPGDTVRFVYVWNFTDDNNVNLTEDVFHYYLDPNCIFRHLAYNEQFLLTGSFQIIEKIGKVQLEPALLSLCYIRNFLGPHDCPAPPTTCKQQ